MMHTKRTNTFKLFALVLIIGMVFASIPAARVEAATPLDVCPSGCAYSTIQEAIDAAAAGDTINVFPGTYDETANGRILYNGTGPYQFGLFFGVGKDNITLQGVDANGTPVTDYHNVAAFITTNATNSFGTSGIFVEADGITLQGISVGKNASGDNKTIEIIGDNFTLKNSIIEVPTQGGSVYLNDWRYDKTSGKSHLESYTIDGNYFKYNTSVDISSGAGASGPVSGRKIINNVFDAKYSTGEIGEWATVSFNGYCPSVGWFVDPVGGATITGNNFSNGLQYIRTRCIPDDSQFDWNAYWTGNTFDKAVVAVTNPTSTFDVTAYAYGDFTDVRRIGSTIQGEIGNAADGDVIHVAPGTYTEAGQIVINKDLSLVGADKATTIIKPAQDTSGTGDAGSWILVNNGVTFNISKVTLDGIERQIRQGIRFNGSGNVDDVVIQNMLQTGYMGFGIAQGYSNTEARSLSVTNSTFTNFGRVGIQVDSGTGANTATISNNVITCKGEGDHLDYGITIQGGHATITGNTITNCLGVASVDGSTSAAVYANTYFGAPASATITGNTLTNSYAGIAVGYDADDVADVVASNNKITGNQNAIYSTSSTKTVAATQNWFGSVAGPAADQIDGKVTFAPWCADENCTTFAPSTLGEIDLPVGTGAAEVQAALNNAPEGSKIILSGAVPNQAGGFQINTPHLTLLLKDGTVIQNSSPCFIVNADYTTITSETLGSVICKPTGDSNGIDVAAGLKNIIIQGIEIDGSSTTLGNGIAFAGAVTDVQILDNFIHNLPASALNFAAAPAGTVDIQGNLFTGNTGVGIASPASVNAEYNSWGTFAAPVNAGAADFDPFTHVDLYLTSSGAPWADQFVSGQQISYTVYGNLQNVMAADFDLLIPTGLTYVSSAAGSAFENVTLTPSAGKLNFRGYNIHTPASGAALPLFTVTLSSVTAGTYALNLDETSDAFGMLPSAGPSTNIYAMQLVDGSVKVLSGLPALAFSGLDTTFAAGFAQEFGLSITNPVDGGTFAAPQLQFVLPTGATLQYLNGATWETVTGGIVNPGVLNPATTMSLSFKITFAGAGSESITATLFDTLPEPDVQLATVTQSGITVNPNFTLSGTISMQGRTVRSGIPVLLTMVDPALYGPFSGLTVDVINNNLSIGNVALATYTFTTNQPRYLNVTADLAKTMAVSESKTTINPLELKGGNAIYTDNVINVDDAGKVGSDYGSTVDTDGDVNFSGKVDIFDLALVGGNFDLTSSDVYAAWQP